MFQSIYTAGPWGFWIFVAVTGVICGAIAFVTGRAIAETWRPAWQVGVYAVLITFISRFLHYALFAEVLLSLGNFVVDFVVIFALAVGGYVRVRHQQMATQYNWPGATG